MIKNFNKKFGKFTEQHEETVRNNAKRRINTERGAEFAGSTYFSNPYFTSFIRIFTTTMRAAVVRAFGPAGNIETALAHPKPTLTAANSTLVRMMTAGVNPVDTYVRSGQYAVLPSLPYTPCKDGAGIVEQVGNEVNNVKPGDRVWVVFPQTGTAAAYSLTTHAFPLPNCLSFEQGASIGVPYVTAYRALFILGGGKSGDRVLIHGSSGGVGVAAVQLAKWKNMHVVGTAGTEEGLKMVKDNGADAVYNHREDVYIDKIKADYKDGFDLVIEMAAHINLNRDTEMLAKRGKVAVVGNRAETTINARNLMKVEGSIFGVGAAHTTDAELSMIAEEINKLFTSTKYRPVVHKIYPLEELEDAFKNIMSSTAGALGNHIIRINADEN